MKIFSYSDPSTTLGMTKMVTLGMTLGCIMKKNKLSGEVAFDEYYGSLFGDRWISLKEAFLRETDSVEFSVGGCKPYFLDSASKVAAEMLPLENAENILDLCAAPGGKTLVIASRMSETAHLTSNERSPERKNRLSKVVAESLPENIKSRVTVTCSDGAKMCLKRAEEFDAILLDAPCSSERHVFNDKKYLDVWTPSRVKTLAISQWALLSSAWRMLKAGGFLLYSTCALSEAENDGVIERLLKKFDDVEIVTSVTEPVEVLEGSGGSRASPTGHFGEPTKFGRQILPDVSNGAGPIYFCLCRKL